MRVLFAGIPAYGHILPLIPLAEAFQRAGHDVLVATGSPVTQLPGFAVESVVDLELSEADAEVLRRHPDWAALPPPERWRLGLELFADVAHERFFPGIDRAIDRWRPDLVVAESMATAPMLAGLRAQVPVVALGITRWAWFPRRLYDEVARRHATPKSGSSLVEIYLDPFPASLADPAEPELPTRLALRSVASDIFGGEFPDELRAQRDRPWVYLTMGTVSHGNVELLRHLLGALSAHDVRVLVTVGPTGDPSALGEVGSRVVPARFVPQAAVLRRVDAVIHHGGSGTMLGAAAAGIPQLVLPQGADQFENATALPRTGAGIAVLPGMAHEALTDAIATVLHEPGMHTAAAALAKEIADQPSPEEVVTELVARFN